MNDLKKKLQQVTRKAKAVVYPDKEALKRQWAVKAEKDKLNQTRRK